MIGATINQTGAFRFRATKLGGDTLLAQIIRLVRQAQASKAPIQRLADSVSRVFVPVVIFIAVATFVVWFDVGPDPALTRGLVAARRRGDHRLRSRPGHTPVDHGGHRQGR